MITAYSTHSMDIEFLLLSWLVAVSLKLSQCVIKSMQVAATRRQDCPRKRTAYLFRWCRNGCSHMTTDCAIHAALDA